MPTDFVYFDLGNVLVNFSHRRAAEQMAAVAGIEPDQVWQFVFEGDVQRALETGRIDSAEFCRRFAEICTAPFDPQALVHAASDIFWLNRPIVPLVSQLAATGVGLGILSNTCEAHWTHVVRRFPWITQLFPHLVLSYAVGAMKPERDIYRQAIELTGTRPERILFVDDRPDNVAGAQAAGLDAHVFVSVPQVQQLLVERGWRFNY